MKPALRTALLALAALALPAHAAAQEDTLPRLVPPVFAEEDTVPAKAGVRVCAGGDVTLGTNLDTGWARRASQRYGVRVDPFPDPDSLLAPLRPLVEDADVVLLNVEGAIGEGPAPRKCRPGSTQCYAFRQPTGTAAALRRVADSAAVVGNVANNHAGDAGWQGLRATIRHLREAGVHVTGADTLPTVVATAEGDTIAVLGYSTSGGPDPRKIRAVRRHVRRAVERWGRVVVTMHMGAEGIRAQRTPNRTEIFLGSINRGNSVAFARAAAEEGAALVVGHGPHVMRAVEWHEGALILYSLGNLLTYGPFSLAEPLNRGAVACATLHADGGVDRAELRPTRQRPPGLVSRDLLGRAAVLADSLSRLDFPRSRARIRPDGTIEPPAAAARAKETPRKSRPGGS